MVESCRTFGIPKYIVDIRHAITHQNAPDISELRSATNFCLDWLWKNFWLSDACVAMNSVKAGTSRSAASAANEFSPQQGREQQFVASLRAFNTWRSKINNRNLTDVECTFSDELIALKQHLLLDATGFLTCFLRDGHLIKTPYQLKEAKLSTSASENYTIPEVIQSFWEPLFHMIFSLKLGADIVSAFLSRLREQCLLPDSKNQITAYVRMILHQFNDADVFTVQEWAKVLDHLLAVAKHFNTKLVDLVMSHCTSMTRKRRKQVHRILNISESPNTSLSEEPVQLPMTPGGGIVHTVEDLQKLLKRERKGAKGSKGAKESTSGIELCDPDEWADVPFGMAPGQRLETFTVVVEETDSRRKRKAFDAAITLEDDDDNDLQ
uniref:Uncharacterized protein n=1 Tax=Caenorhabditis japonica TaxID=281687 RepID=A0A8R1HW36_CAEJA